MWQFRSRSIAKFGAFVISWSVVLVPIHPGFSLLRSFRSFSLKGGVDLWKAVFDACAQLELQLRSPRRRQWSWEGGGAATVEVPVSHNSHSNSTNPNLVWGGQVIVKLLQLETCDSRILGLDPPALSCLRSGMMSVTHLGLSDLPAVVR